MFHLMSSCDVMCVYLYVKSVNQGLCVFLLRWSLPPPRSLSGRHAGGPSPGASRPRVAGSRGGGGEPADPVAAQPIARHRRSAAGW